MQSWLALKTKYRHEKIVEAVLMKKNVQNYLPQVASQRSWSDRTKTTHFPLFPGYIFVRPLPEQYPSLRFLPGSCGLVNFSGKPAEMRNEEIESLRILVSSSETLSLHSSLMIGQNVRVVAGPLKGAEGHIVKFKNRHHLAINAIMLNKAITVELSRLDVRRI